MINKTPENVHKICFWVIWRIFKCGFKIDLIIFLPAYVKLLFSSLVQQFDFFTIDILHITGHFEHSSDIFDINFLLEPPQPIHGYFFYHTSIHS